MSRKVSSPWIILVVIILFNMAPPLTQFKVPPVMPVLMQEFNFSAGAASMLMSIFALTGMMIGIPAGFIFRHAGVRITGLIIMLTLSGGAALGAFSNGFFLLLMSRFIEGIGLSLASILGPPVIAYYFPGKRLTKAMGFSSMSVPAGLMMAFTLSPFIERLWNWQTIWLVFSAFSLITGILFFFKVGSAASGMHRKIPENASGHGGIGKVLRNRDIWLLSFLLMSFNAIFSTYLTWFPSYAHTERGLPLTEADLLTSVMTLFLIFSGPLGGWLCERIGSRKVIYIFPLFVFVFVLAFTPVTATPGLPVIMIVLGLVISFVPTALFSEVTEIVRDSRLQGLAMGIILMGQNAGMLTGPMSFGIMLDKGFGWYNSFIAFIPVGILGIIAGLSVKGSRHHIGSQQHE
ncbi:MAG: MFS transporter [Spirochaetes bacterium]|nr:MFS transporter [Spirochaetota bacterium]